MRSIPQRSRKSSASKVDHQRMLRWASGLTDLETIEISRKGIRGKVLGQIQDETGFSSQDWSDFLQCDLRTIQRYRRENRLIDAAASERALLMAQLVMHGRDVFGTDAQFLLWLNGPSPALGGKTPREFLGSATGMALVRGELIRIEHGLY